MGNLSTNRKHIILADAGILIPASATIYSKQNSNFILTLIKINTLLFLLKQFRIYVYFPLISFSVGDTVLLRKGIYIKSFLTWILMIS